MYLILKQLEFLVVTNSYCMGKEEEIRRFT